jgi:hypothetical protein
MLGLHFLEMSRHTLVGVGSISMGDRVAGGSWMAAVLTMGFESVLLIKHMLNHKSI